MWWRWLPTIWPACIAKAGGSVISSTGWKNTMWRWCWPRPTGRSIPRRRWGESSSSSPPSSMNITRRISRKEPKTACVSANPKGFPSVTHPSVRSVMSAGSSSPSTEGAWLLADGQFVPGRRMSSRKRGSCGAVITSARTTCSACTPIGTSGRIRSPTSSTKRAGRSVTAGTSPGPSNVMTCGGCWPTGRSMAGWCWTRRPKTARPTASRMWTRCRSSRSARCFPSSCCARSPSCARAAPSSRWITASKRRTTPIRCRA